jgi:hypothetical protein
MVKRRKEMERYYSQKIKPSEIAGPDDLSPKISAMTMMRFPDKLPQWRFQHEEEALQ